MEIKDYNDHCTICLHPIKINNYLGISKLPCGHLFHLSCFMKWEKLSCPLCRDITLSFADTTIFDAVKSGNEKHVKYFIDNKVDLESRDINQCMDTPLIWAVYNRHKNVTKLLLESGANPNNTCLHNDTALIWATKNMDIDIIKLLVKHGARADLKNNDNKSALDIIQSFKNKYDEDLINMSYKLYETNEIYMTLFFGHNS
jgi:ankyrin repeat protein